MHDIETAASGSVAYDILAILWDGPRPRVGIVRAFEERRGVRPPDPHTIDPILRELEAGALITARDAGGQRVYAIADRGSDALARAVP